MSLIYPSAGPESAQVLLENGFTCIKTASFEEEIRSILAGMTLLTEDARLGESLGKLIVGKDEIGQSYDAGLWERDDGREHKFFFHYIPELDSRLRNMPSELRTFGEACSSLTDQIHRLVLVLAKTIDTLNAQAAGAGSYREPIAPLIARGIKVLRLLRYLPREPRTARTFDATPHFDRSGISARAWESRPRTILYDKTGVPVPASAVPDGNRFDDVLVFPGEKFMAVTDGTFGDIGMHAVQDAHPESPENRFAVVLFQHLVLNAVATAWLRQHQPRLEQLEQACKLQAA